MALDELQVALDFFAPLLGVLIAFLVTAWWDNWRTKGQEKEDRRRILSSIHKELQTNLDFLSELDKKETYAAGQMFQWRDAYQSAINGGKIIMLDPKNQTEVATVYLNMGQLETYGGKVLAMLGTTTVSQESKDVFDFVMKEMKRSLQRTLSLIPKGLEVLEAELRRLDSSPPPGIPPASQISNPSPNPNRDIDLLKINLAADYRLGMLVAMTGAYFALIVGLFVAWYQKYPDNLLGYYLIAGVFGSLLITQELRPYQRWLKQVDEWLKRIENYQRIGDITKLARQVDRLKTSGQAILIFLFLLDFYLTLLGQYPPVELFLVFTSVGITVAFFTEGGIDLVRKWRGGSDGSMSMEGGESR